MHRNYGDCLIVREHMGSLTENLIECSRQCYLLSVRANKSRRWGALACKEAFDIGDDRVFAFFRADGRVSRRDAVQCRRRHEKSPSYCTSHPTV